MNLLSNMERVDWLRLTRSETIGPISFFRLIDRFRSAHEALKALPNLAHRGGRAQALKIMSAEEAEAELLAGEALGAQLICCQEPLFPRRLSVLDPPPPLIWVLGHTTHLTKPSIAIVGARAASTAGRRFARSLAADLGEAGYLVVSGMARGIDAAAHEGALPFATAAILAGGIDDVYPPEHLQLYQQIAAAGCIISERPIGYGARAADFPRRNRIISGMSLGVVVVEAEVRSGSLITARLAAEQGREVFAVPGSPLDPRARGSNDLLRQGATLVEDADDVRRVLEAYRGMAEPEVASDAEDFSVSETQIDSVRDAVAACLGPTPTPIDALARDVDAPTAWVLAALVELSLAGRAELLAGGLAAAI